MKHCFLIALLIALCLPALCQQAAHKGEYSVYGYIYDSQTGESLIAATVYNPQSLKGATSNEFGHYSITLPRGQQKIVFSYVGYASYEVSLRLEADTMLVVKLQPDAELAEVVVTDNRPEVGVKSTRMGASTVPLDIVRNMPTLLSEPDVLKTIQALPGVQPGLAGTSGIHVRGGDPDQNLFLLDGMPLYNTSHVFGFLSVFQSEAIKNVDFYKSSFPARFGGRLSSIVDVRTKDGDMNKYYGSLSIGLLTSHMSLEGPIVKGKTSFILSARRSYFDLLARPFLSEIDGLNMNLSDINAKINHRFSDKCRLYLSYYKGQDKMGFSTKDKEENWSDKEKVYERWGNQLATIRLNTVISPKLFNNTTVAFTGYNSTLYNKYDCWFNEYTLINLATGETGITKSSSMTESKYQSDIKDYSVLSDFDYHISSNHSGKFGVAFHQHVFNPDVQSSRNKQSNAYVSLDSTFKVAPEKVTSQELNMYAEDDFPILPSLQANIGLHFSMYFVDGENYVSLQPRVSLNWKLSDTWQLKGAYCTMQQNVHMLSSSEMTLPSDLWVPITKRIKPMTCTHYSVGGYYTGIKQWELSMETYYKHSRNLLDYKEGTSAVGSSTNWQDKVDMGTGESYGIEWMAQKKEGKLTGWVNYTLSKSDRKFSKGSINDGHTFPYKYDRRHNLNITACYQLSDKIDFNAEWQYMSGAHTTIASGLDLYLYGYGSNDAAHPAPGVMAKTFRYGSRNGYALPSVHQLNVGINFHKQKPRGERIWNFSIINVYGHKNPDYVMLEEREVDKVEGDEKTFETRYFVKKLTFLPFIPSFSYTFKFK